MKAIPGKGDMTVTFNGGQWTKGQIMQTLDYFEDCSITARAKGKVLTFVGKPKAVKK